MSLIELFRYPIPSKPFGTMLGLIHQVWMIQPRQFPIRGPNLIQSGILTDTQDLVMGRTHFSHVCDSLALVALRRLPQAIPPPW